MVTIVQDESSVVPLGNAPASGSSTGPQLDAVESLPLFSDELQPGHVSLELLGPQSLELLAPETELPPPFTPYEAQYFKDNAGNIISHDPHLNEDGEALTRFLLAHAAELPEPVLKIRGHHQERKTRLVTGNEGGRSKTRLEEYTENVVDFDFAIGLVECLKHSAPCHYSVGDDEPAYRGEVYREIDRNIDGYIVAQRAPKDQAEAAKRWRKYRTRSGFAPWIGPKNGWEVANSGLHTRPPNCGVRVPEDIHILKRSSRTLRQWADAYCASDKVLKEFLYEKIVYGWSINELENAITSLIKSTYYRGNFSISWETRGTKISIRPDTRLSRMLSKTWIKVLLWIFLIYPFILLFKRFHSRGGGRWEVCGAAYPFKRVVKLDTSDPDFKKKVESGEATRIYDGDYVETIGRREGQWFRKWESTIRENVIGRVQTDEIITIPNPDRSQGAGSRLDGYMS